MSRLIATVMSLAAALPLAARQGAALKDLMPAGMVIGVAINQRQSDGVDTAAVDIITTQFNQISPENLLKFQPVHPAADRYVFEPQDRYVQFGVDRRMQVIGHNLVLRIDGIGNQGHWQLETPPIGQIEDALVDLRTTGLKVMYTELDINMLPPGGRNAAPAATNPTPTDCPPRNNNSSPGATRKSSA